MFLSNVFYFQIHSGFQCHFGEFHEPSFCCPKSLFPFPTCARPCSDYSIVNNPFSALYMLIPTYWFVKPYFVLVSHLPVAPISNFFLAREEVPCRADSPWRASVWAGVPSPLCGPGPTWLSIQYWWPIDNHLH